MYLSKSRSLQLPAQAEELIELAARKNLTIMVDHTFLFTGAVRKIRQLIEDGTLGKLYYYDSTQGQSRALSARCQCDLGSCAPRSLDHGLPDRGQTGIPGRHGTDAI